MTVDDPYWMTVSPVKLESGRERERGGGGGGGGGGREETNLQKNLSLAISWPMLVTIFSIEERE